METEKLLEFYGKRVMKWIDDNILLTEGYPEIFYSPARRFIGSGGKRLRPTLVYLTNEVYNGDIEDADPASASVEMLHNALLIPDDYQDGSKQRREQECLYISEGLPQALNISYGMLAKAYECLEKGLPLWTKKYGDTAYKTFQKCSTLLRDGIFTAVTGQMMEIEMRDKGGVENATEEWYNEMARYKTAEYTGKKPMQMGATVARRTDLETEEIGELGENIGRAFQKADDILNIKIPTEAMNEHRYGKEFGGDIEEGKLTLIVIYAFQNANENDREKILKIYGKRHIDEEYLYAINSTLIPFKIPLEKSRSLIYEKRPISLEEKMEIIKIFKKTGAIDYVKESARKELEYAKRKIVGIMPATQGREKLLESVDFVYERTW